MNTKKTLLLFLSNFIIIAFQFLYSLLWDHLKYFLAIIRNLDLSIRIWVEILILHF